MVKRYDCHWEYGMCIEDDGEWVSYDDYEALQAENERLRKLHQDAYQRGHQSGSRGLREAYDAIQEVKRQDAWGNAQLTEALLAAEERAERVEFENAALTAENERLKADAEKLERFRSLARWVSNCAGHGINSGMRAKGEELLVLINAAKAVQP